jgi:hypothetical protein
MIIPSELQFTAERLMKSANRVGTADNDINADQIYGDDSSRLCSEQLLN